MTAPLRRLERLPEHPAPAIDVEAHTLRVAGHVQTPRDYRIEELRALAGTLHVEDFECLEGWVVPDQAWGGVPLATLLDLAGPSHEAAEVTEVSIGSGTFNVVLPIADARRALLALELDGEPLAVAHGGPPRLVVPGGECYTSIKWVDRITLCTAEDDVRGSAREVAMRRIGLDPER